MSPAKRTKSTCSLERAVEHPLDRPQRSIGHQVGQTGRDLAQPAHRTLEMKVAGVNESQGRAGHICLLAHDAIAARLQRRAIAKHAGTGLQQPGSLPKREDRDYLDLPIIARDGRAGGPGTVPTPIVFQGRKMGNIERFKSLVVWPSTASPRFLGERVFDAAGLSGLCLRPLLRRPAVLRSAALATAAGLCRLRRSVRTKTGSAASAGVCPISSASAPSSASADLAPGDADVAQPALFVDRRSFGGHRAMMRQQSFFHADQVDVRKFESLGAVQRHQGDGVAGQLRFLVRLVVAIAQ